MDGRSLRISTQLPAGNASQIQAGASGRMTKLEDIAPTPDGV